MNEQDAAPFEEILVSLHVAMSRPAPTPPVVKMWWTTMQEATLEQFSCACGEHLATSTRPPLPAAIRDLIGLNNSPWPTPEEAWNMLPKEENDGGWLCQEMAAAMGACLDSLVAGDRIGARMAFLEVYRREIKGNGGEPKWWLSEPAGLSYQQRIQWKQEMLELKPGTRKDLEHETRAQLESSGVAGRRSNLGTLSRVTPKAFSG